MAIERDWETWLTTLFGAYLNGFGAHHCEFWDWLWSIEANQRPAPFVAIWPRGGGKSTAAELAAVALGARGRRRYALYISETQEQADDHVQNVASLLESSAIDATYPALGARMLGKFGNSRGWRRDRIRTSAGLTIDALGLDTAARGVKLEDARPDLMIFDDLDGVHDTPPTTRKKVETITKTLLPAGAPHLAVLAIQNLVHPDGIFAQLADGRADFLHDRILSGPVPAIRNLETEQQAGRTVIVAGDATWQGQDLARCQAMLDDMGISAFLSECQHHVDDPPGGLFSHIEFQRCNWDDLPDLVRTVVWIDPAVTDTKQSDAHGIQADGIDTTGTIYRLFSWEQRASPEEALHKAISIAVRYGARTVGVETDQGGDLWRRAFESAVRRMRDAGDIPVDAPTPAFVAAKAGAGHGPKTHRATLMLADYERGRFVHVRGTHATLERALRRFPLRKPFDLVDCAYWAWADLTGRLQQDTVPTVRPLVAGAGGGRLQR